jgi:hypothetical protein
MSSFEYESDDYEINYDGGEDCDTAGDSSEPDDNQGGVLVEGDAVESGDEEPMDVIEVNEDNNNLLELSMPERKRKEPAHVWKLADRVKGGPICKFCMYSLCTNWMLPPP